MQGDLRLGFVWFVWFVDKNAGAPLAGYRSEFKATATHGLRAHDSVSKRAA
jgi:hypothetical protein